MPDEFTPWSLPGETKEWVGPITVLADGDVTNAFKVTVTAPGARPVNWQDAIQLDFSGGYGVMVGVGTAFPLVVGRKYTVWIRYTDAPEQPVRKVGTIRVY
jgi:hypothetical protein